MSQKNKFTPLRACILYIVSLLLLLIISGILLGVFNAPILYLQIYTEIFAILLPVLLFAKSWNKQKIKETFSFRRVKALPLIIIAIVGVPLNILCGYIQQLTIVLFNLNIETYTKLGEGLICHNVQDYIVSFLGMVFLAAFCEEMLFRGYIQTAYVKKIGASWGIFLTAILFSAYHLDMGGFFSRILLGLWFGLLFVRFGSIWPAIIAHAVNNFFAAIITINFLPKLYESEFFSIIIWISGIIFILGWFLLDKESLKLDIDSIAKADRT